ncbi:MAG: hypothetical protein Satyrvirus21_6 [Satyrvirus sp.]|uniref:Uncharacterized protein n=1 Tax=Satyrvirus sp. TaxID=2487771 RepID=A0A3G5AEA9_9VIRU|nr:MAG: hypothetical protein Satyrvirus21_6 [Satyrvirus sp.]
MDPYYSENEIENIPIFRKKSYLRIFCNTIFTIMSIIAIILFLVSVIGFGIWSVSKNCEIFNNCTYTSINSTSCLIQVEDFRCMHHQTCNTPYNATCYVSYGSVCPDFRCGNNKISMIVGIVSICTDFVLIVFLCFFRSWIDSKFPS